MDPAPAVFVIYLQGANKNTFCLLIFEGKLNNSLKKKSHKEVTKQ
jgi:hypothetical protein